MLIFIFVVVGILLKHSDRKSVFGFHFLPLKSKNNSHYFNSRVETWYQ